MSTLNTSERCLRRYAKKDGKAQVEVNKIKSRPLVECSVGKPRGHSGQFI